jgi:hypothetical protein
MLTGSMKLSVIIASSPEFERMLAVLGGFDNLPQRRMLLFIGSAGNDTPKGVGFSLQTLEVISLRDL